MTNVKPETKAEPATSDAEPTQTVTETGNKSRLLLKPHQAQKPFGYKAYMSLGLGLVLALITGAVLWSLLAPIHGAVVSQGVLIVESKPKQIQHSIGGVVGDILVENGDFVRENQPLIRLDAAQASSALNVATSAYLELYALERRLIAERDQTDMVDIPYPDLVTVPYSGWAGLIDVQTATFLSRRQSIDGHLQRIDQQITQSKKQITGLEAVLESRIDLKSITETELANSSKLFAQGVISNEKVINLRRDVTQLKGEIGRQMAEIARVKSLISEREIEAIQLAHNFREEVLSELQQLSPQLKRSKEEFILAQKRSNEIDVKSPVDGFVHGLRLHTIGGIVSVGETIMQIIPHDDDLVIEARVLPQDIDAIFIDQQSSVILSAFSQRDTPELQAKVFNRSADRFFDETTGMSYYIVMARFLPGELEKLKDKQALPGMPADIFFQTGPRSAFTYLTGPFIDALNFAFREE